MEVLIIDEMGCFSLDDLGATIFLQLVRARYERGSIILISNKSAGDWRLDLRRPHHRDGHPGRAAAPLDHDQHTRGELPAQDRPASQPAGEGRRAAGKQSRGDHSGAVFRAHSSRPAASFRQSRTKQHTS